MEQIENLLLIRMLVFAVDIMDYLCKVGSFHNRCMDTIYSMTEQKMMVEHDSSLLLYKINITVAKLHLTGFYHINQTHDHSMNKYCRIEML